MEIVLIGGMWLDASAWDDVAARLREKGLAVTAVALPGQGAPPADATFDDQRAAVLAAVDAASGPVLVVGHSAACTLAWIAADARPEEVAKVAMIGGFPEKDGDTYFGEFPVVDGVVPFPGWEPFEGPDSADLDQQQRAAFEAAAVAVSGGVTTGTVRLSDDRRYTVPVTLICPEFSPEQAREWAEGGEVPELAKAKTIDYVNIDSGHWPMYSRPAELTSIIAELAQ
jgi:pimeloyl-ACP methyl ester carboxylesterase